MLMHRPLIRNGDGDGDEEDQEQRSESNCNTAEVETSLTPLSGIAPHVYGGGTMMMTENLELKKVDK